MVAINVQLRSIPDTNAALGWAGAHTMVVDRPIGRAGGMDLGFNGGQLLALAIGGCLCNDLRYVAEKQGIAISTIAVDVALTLSGEPLIATEAEVKVSLTADAPDTSIDGLLAATAQVSTVSNSVMRGVAVRIVRAG